MEGASVLAAESGELLEQEREEWRSNRRGLSRLAGWEESCPVEQRTQRDRKRIGLWSKKLRTLMMAD